MADSSGVAVEYMSRHPGMGVVLLIEICYRGF